ncbi:MFS transporter [Aestuariibius insulae]|uniref:MFS transporter n=1 Tax=Aestuariibius insulae TaxID=2058287 RepID=UPI00345EA7F4
MDRAGLKITLLFGASLTVMSGATISPSLPALRDQFAETANIEVLARLVLTLPALFIAITAPLSGWAIDRLGRLKILMGGSVLYALAGMSGLVVDNITAMLVGRAVLGVSVGLMMPTVTTLAGDYFQGEERGRYLGLQAAFMGFGGLVFVTGGGFLADLYWRAPFAIYGASLLLIPMVIAFLPEPPRKVAPEIKTGEGRIPPVVFAIYGVAFFSMMAFYLVPTQLPFLLSGVIQIPEPSRAGMAIGVATLFSSAASLLYGRITGRMPVALFFSAGLGLMAVAYALVWLSAGYGAILIAMIALGTGMGTIMPALSVTLLSAAPEHIRGRLAGGLTASIFLGQFVSPILSQGLAGAIGGLQGVFAAFALALALACGLALIAGLRRSAKVAPVPAER